MAIDERPGEAAPVRSKWEKWQQFIWYAVLGGGAWWILASGEIDGWKWLVAVGFALICPVVAVLSFFAALRDWPDAKAESITVRTLLWVFGLPAALIAGIYILGRVSEALDGTPWWAVTIIVLLVILVIQQHERR